MINLEQGTLFTHPAEPDKYFYVMETNPEGVEGAFRISAHLKENFKILGVFDTKFEENAPLEPVDIEELYANGILIRE